MSEELVARCAKAYRELRDMAERRYGAKGPDVEYWRLEGKAEGLSLAISYMEEALRECHSG